MPATLIVLFVLAAGPAGAVAQQIGAHAIGVFHWTDPTPRARAEHAWQLVHPMVMAVVPLGKHFGVRATANLEGLAIPNGELAVGNWGEGFVDRRHPHTYAHEIIADGAGSIGCGGRCRVGGFAGKGFVPFGSDDPMTRPILRFPVNHHLAQVLERAVVGLQAAAGPFLVEGALFNGDEPETPGQWPRIGGRFGDSWAARVTLTPAAGIEIAGSVASVASPEHRPGAGANQSKWHLGTRYDRAGTTGLAEWSRTSEFAGIFVFETILIEAARAIGLFQVAFRIERTDRPEEERIEPNRSARPHLENSILGASRWTLATAAISYRARRPSRLQVAPFLEVTRGHITASSTAFSAATTYGKERLWSVSIGARLAVGMHHGGIGRYGLRRPPTEVASNHH